MESYTLQSVRIALKLAYEQWKQLPKTDPKWEEYHQVVTALYNVRQQLKAIERR